MGLPSKSVRGASSPPPEMQLETPLEKKMPFQMLPTSICQESSTTRSKREGRGQHCSSCNQLRRFFIPGQREAKGKENRSRVSWTPVPDTFSHACRQRPAQSRWLPGISLARPELLLPAAARAPLSEGAAPPRSDQGTPTRLLPRRGKR